MEMNGTGGLDTISSCLNSDDGFDDTSLVFVARTCQWVSNLGVILYQQQALMQNKPNCSSKSTDNPIELQWYSFAVDASSRSFSD